mmetsp:Transcript_11489/g.40063  ORF Transcript_11489/g.40063 Transcript_11489/m.40063 type:complete len:553 (-) Transcript_11489:2178-3836(-)
MLAGRRNVHPARRAITVDARRLAAATDEPARKVVHVPIQLIGRRLPRVQAQHVRHAKQHPLEGVEEVRAHAPQPPVHDCDLHRHGLLLRDHSRVHVEVTVAVIVPHVEATAAVSSGDDARVLHLFRVSTPAALHSNADTEGHVFDAYRGQRVRVVDVDGVTLRDPCNRRRIQHDSVGDVVVPQTREDNVLRKHVHLVARERVTVALLFRAHPVVRQRGVVARPQRDDGLAKVTDGARLVDLQRDAHRLPLVVAEAEHDGHKPVRRLQQRQRQRHERLEPRAFVPAFRARQQRLELPCEERHNRLLAGQVVHPPLLSHLRIWTTIRVRLFHVRLVRDAVEVLVEARQHKVKQLLRVLLLVAIEQRLVLPDHVLEPRRRHRLGLGRPQVAHEVRVHNRQLASGAHLVLDVDIILPVVAEEVLEQRRRVAQALQRAVHEARVAQVVQTNETGHPLLGRARVSLLDGGVPGEWPRAVRLHELQEHLVLINQLRVINRHAEVNQGQPTVLLRRALPQPRLALLHKQQATRTRAHSLKRVHLAKHDLRFALRHLALLV